MTDSSPKPKDRAAADPVATWDGRAEAYLELVARHGLFAAMADGLVARARERGAQRVLDLGAGGGLVCERFVAAGGAPDGLCAAEPAPRLRAHLVATLVRLGGRASAVLDARAEDLGAHFGPEPARAPVEAVLANACLHLFERERALAGIAEALAPGGVLVASLWWHALHDDEARHAPQAHWRAALARALAEHDEAPALAREPRDLVAPPPTLERWRTDAARHGLVLVGAERRDASVPGAFFLDFASLAADFLAEVEPTRRRAVLARAGELVAPCTLGWRELVFERRSARSAP
jgi:SAM-dependent methyltransferase